MPFYTYILSCSDKTYYIGKTNNLQKRLRQHNGELKGGAKYTAGRRPIVLEYFEIFSTDAEAAQREYFLKQLTRKQKMTLISSSKG